MVKDVARLAQELMPYVTATIDVHGTAVVDQVEGASTNTTASSPRRVCGSG